MKDGVRSKEAVVAEIENLEGQWNDAILRRDVAAAASLQADEYKLIIGAEGQPLQVIPRELWLSVLPRYVIQRHEVSDMHVSVWDDVAVATLAITQVAEPLNGRDISGNFLITDTWVRRDEKWLIAERHSSRQERASVPVRETFRVVDRG